MEKPKIILFDLDGTLVDTREIVAEVYAEGLRRMDLQVPSLDFIMSLSGRSTFETGRGLGVPEHRLAEIDSWFWKLFGSFCEDPKTNPHFFPEVPSILEFLRSRGIEMGVVTSNESRNARLLLKKGNLEEYFSAVIGFREVVEPKPSAEPIRVAVEQICKRSGLEIDLSRDVWMVGDSESDLLSALNAEIRPLILGRDLKKLTDLRLFIDEA